MIETSREIEIRKVVFKGKDENPEPGKLIRDTCPSCGKHLLEDGMCCEDSQMSADLCPSCKNSGIELKSGIQICPLCTTPVFVVLS